MKNLFQKVFSQFYMGANPAQYPSSGTTQNQPASKAVTMKSGSDCQTCTILLEQLREARLREARLCRQLERKDEQIGMVIQSKFETVHLSSEHADNEKGSPVLPLDSLMDVQAHDDEAYINQVAKAITQ